MAWAKNGTPDTLTGTADVLTISDMTANTFLGVMCQTIPSGNANPKMTLNNDTGSNYARRRSEEGGSDTTVINQTEIDFGRDPTELVFSISYMINVSTEEKLVIMNNVTNNTNGAGNTPKRSEMVWKWVNTSDSITRTDVTNSQTGDFAIDSNLSVLGTD
jgi:hypothetical protein